MANPSRLANTTSCHTTFPSHNGDPLRRYQTEPDALNQRPPEPGAFAPPSHTRRFVVHIVPVGDLQVPLIPSLSANHTANGSYVSVSALNGFVPGHMLRA